MKLAIAGTGQIVREVLPYLTECGWELAAICTTKHSEESGRELAEQLHRGGTVKLVTCNFSQYSSR